MKGTPSLRKLARCYGIAAPSLIGLRDRLELSPAVLECPEELFDELIENGAGGKLRNILSDPATRRTITANIKSASL
jgi:hypothetical protein